MDFRILDWDSGFFGFSVAKILPTRLEKLRLLQILDQLKKNGVVLTYWAVDEKVSDSIQPKERAGGFLADVKATYQLDLEIPPRMAAPKPEFSVERYPEKIASPDLLDLAFLSGQYSRFHRDPRIPKEKFRQLYQIWIERSVQGELADSVLIFRDGPKIGGMVTLGREGDKGKIGLMAVDPQYQGRGMGQALLRAAREEFKVQGLHLAQVVTQKENGSACRFYEKAGYVLRELQPFYHFWLTDPSSHKLRP